MQKNGENKWLCCVRVFLKTKNTLMALVSVCSADILILIVHLLMPHLILQVRMGRPLTLQLPELL